MMPDFPKLNLRTPGREKKKKAPRKKKYEEASLPLVPQSPVAEMEEGEGGSKLFFPLLLQGERDYFGEGARGREREGREKTVLLLRFIEAR